MSSEKSFPNGLTTSPENGAVSSNNGAHSKAGDVVHTLVNDDIEKKVHVNKDGSLSVEMKVRFRLLNDETLQWSTHIQKSSLHNQMPGEELGIEEGTGLDPIEKMNPEASSEAEESLYPCDADSYISKLDESEVEETHCHNCGWQRKDYDIWKNPMHTSQKEEPGIRNTWYTHSSCSSTSSQRRIVRKKITSFTDSIRTSSSGEEYSEHIVRESSSYSKTVKNRLDGRAVKRCCCQSDRAQPNKIHRRFPREPEAAACPASSQNEDDEDAAEASVVTGEDGEGRGNKAGSGRSKASQCSIDSQTKVCEESSTVARSLSSCSVKKTEDLEDVVGCVSTPNSICSKSSKCSTPRAKDDQEETSENEQVIPSFSSEHCPKAEAAEDEAGKVEEDIEEIHSISENMVSKQSITDEVSDCERNSTGKSFHPQTHESMRSDSDEVQICSVASSSSRISKKSKHGQNHLEADSKVSSKGSSTTIKRKKTTSSLRAEDVRSNSTASYCSRSSHELERAATEGHGSRDSNPLQSEVAPPSATNDESTSNISKRYSKSSRSSKKESQPEAANSPRSSFSESNEKNRDGTANVSSQLPSSKTGSVSESTCSKCGRAAPARNSNHQSVNSRISSPSGTKPKCPEAEKSEDACSQSSVAQSSKPRQKKTNSLLAEAEQSSQASVSESASMYSLHCPVPPKGRPSNRKRRTVVLKKSSKSASVCTESEPTADPERKERSDSFRLTSSVSKSLETDRANAEGNNSDMVKEETGSCQEKEHEEETEAAEDGDGEMIPSSLPNATPEEVVHAWLRNIPSETLLMKDEMDDDGEEDLSAEIPSTSNHPEFSEEDKKQDDTEMLEDTPATEEVEDGAEEQAEEAIKDHSEKASEAMSAVGQAEGDHSAVLNQNSPQRDLPSTIQSSVQIMKALLASKQDAKLDRSQSLPEVSPTMGRKLGDSAKILITCLASLQLLDEELDPPDKSKPSSGSRYMELLNIFQTLWFGCAPESSGPSTEQQGKKHEKVVSGLKGRPPKHGHFTAMSSSGVDVSSGDGGSRAGSVAGGQDRAFSPEEIEEAEEATEEQSEEIVHRKLFLEEEEAGGDVEEQEGPSRPATACSKSEGGEKAESSRAEEVAEAHDDQGSECEMGQEEDKENTGEGEKESSSKNEDENGECAEAGAEAHPTQEGLEEEPFERGNSPPQEEADGATEQPSGGETESDPNASERVQESHAEKQLVDKAPADGEPGSRVTHQATVTTSPAAQERPIDPDPVWVLKLLKKIEKEFMTHYVSAMNDFKIKWNLPNNEELDVMIAELKEEVSKRIQKSIEKELRKIQSRAGKRVPRPPNSELRRDSTQQTEGRRRRLHRMSLLNGSQSKQPDSRNLSCDQDEMDFFFSTTIKDDVSDLLSDDEYCPCDACLRKKMSSKPTMNTVVVMSNAPVVKAFDLQKILQTKKDHGTEKKEPEEEKEVLMEPAEEEPEEHKENPATEPSEERNPDETNEQQEEEVNEDGTEVVTNEVEAEGEEASNTENETKIEGETKAQEEDEEVKEDETKEEVEEDKVEQEEQREEEEDVKEEEEEEKEMTMDKQKGQEDDVEEGEKEEEKEEEEGVKEEEEEKEEEMKDDKEEENTEEKGEEEGGVEEQKEEEKAKEEEEQKEGEEEMEEEEKGEEVMKDDQEEGEEIEAEEGDMEEQKENEDVKEHMEEEGEEKEEEEREEVKQDEGEDDEEREEIREEEEDVKEEKEEMEEEEEMRGDKEEDNMEEKGDEEEVEVEEQKEDENVEEEQKEGEEAMGEKEKGEEDMEEEEAVKEEEEKQEEENTEKECEEKEEEVAEDKEEGDINEEEAEREEKIENEEDEEKNVKEKADGMEEVVDEEKDEDVKEEEGENEEIDEEEIIENVKEENEEKGEEEEKEVEEAQDEKEEEDVKEEDEIKEEEEDKEEEVEVITEEEEEIKEECKDEEEIKDEEVEEEVDMKVEEKEEEEEEKVEENDVKEEEEETKEMEEEEAKEEVAPEEDNQEAKSEGEEETNEEKEMDEEKEEICMEAEEEPKLEDETDGTIEEPEAAEGDCAENIADAQTVQVSGGEGAEEDNDAEDEIETFGGSEADEKAEIEAGSDDAVKQEEEESYEPVQNDEDEKSNKAEDEETIEGLEPSRSASAFSYSSSVGNCSHQSQKGSEDRSDGEDCNEEENENINSSVDEDAQTDTKTKPATMYPESVEEEEEEEDDQASLQESSMKGGEAKTSRNKEGGQTSVKQGNSNEAIDPDDLDF